MATTSEELTVDAFDSVKVDIAFAEIEIHEGDAFKVAYTFPSTVEPSIEVEDGTLVISANSSNTTWNINGGKYCLEITVLTGTSLENLDMKLDAGDLTVKGLSIDNVEITCDAGNVELYDLTSEKLHATADAGNIELHNVRADSFTADADAGNIEIVKSEILSVDLQADAGSLEIESSTVDKVKATADLGSIYLSGEFVEIEANCSLGSVEVKTDGNASGVKMELRTSLGNVVVNGQDKGSSYHQ